MRGRAEAPGPLDEVPVQPVSQCVEHSREFRRSGCEIGGDGRHSVIPDLPPMAYDKVIVIPGEAAVDPPLGYSKPAEAKLVNRSPATIT